jgi:REP element-mobilizing transposase RayT
MSDYRRWYLPGGTSFFTVVTYRRFRLFDELRAQAKEIAYSFACASGFISDTQSAFSPGW